MEKRTLFSATFRTRRRCVLTITLSPELELVLSQRASQSGSTPEQEALDTLQRDLLPSEYAFNENSVRVARLQQLASPAGISLPEEALSRETL